ncbi:hypothetical protein PROPHIGD17-1_39 [Mycobacterium phage prophiGD17-1]|nr:hypothetical protein PROPHIGD17-1_39 [Mycobacterium phage prophiGD17-1]
MHIREIRVRMRHPRPEPWGVRARSVSADTTDTSATPEKPVNNHNRRD